MPSRGPCTRGAGCEIREVSYASFAEAQQRGHTGPGRAVPNCVPREATSIAVAYDADTFARWIRFSLTHIQVEAYQQGLQPPDQKTMRKRPGRPTWRWWPSELLGTLNREDLHAAGDRLYTAAIDEAAPALIAVRGTEVFCWCR